MAANNQSIAKARQNALMAMNIALGRLQQTAGADARVTASAGLLNETFPNRDWVGVWDSSATGNTTSADPLAWLVSGLETEVSPSENLADNRDAVLMIDAGVASGGTSRDRAVYAKQQKLRAAGVPGFDPSQTLTIGSFAYWVADEGQKARVLAMPSRSSATDLPHGYYADTTNGALPRLRTLQMGARAPAAFPDVAEFDVLGTATQAKIKKLVTLEQLGLFGSEGVGPEQVIERWHDYSAYSSGVPVDTVTGSLRKDLSHSLKANLGAAPAAYQALATSTRALNDTPSYSVIPYEGIDGQPGYVVAPIITEFFFQASIHNGPGNTGTAASRATQKSLEVRGRFFFELWNPYTSALTIPADSLRVLVKGLPEVTVTGSGAAGSTVVNLQTIYPNESDGVKLDLPLTSTTWAPGRIHTFGHPSGYNSTTALSLAKARLTYESDYRTTYWAVTPATAVLSGTPDTSTRFTFTTSGPVRLKLELQVFSGGTWTTVSTYEMPEYLRLNVVSGVASTDRFPDFGFSYRMLDRHDYLQKPEDSLSTSDWLTHLGDLRRGVYPGDLFTPTIDDDAGSYNSDAPQSDKIDQKFIFNRNMPSSTFDGDTALASPSYDFALYEVPRQEQLSVGGLQHLVFTKADGSARRSYALGNSWAGDNMWFDRYFLSGVPTTTTQGTTTLELPNNNTKRVLDPSVGLVMDDLTLRSSPNKAAAAVVINGAFNINSTSVAAWRAVLSGTQLKNWSYVTRDASSLPAGSKTVDMPNPFFRFSQTAGEMWDWNTTIVPATNKAAPRRFYRRGAKTLTEVQISRLSQAIVTVLREARVGKGPFPSIEAFLAPNSAFGDRNVLDEAISRADATAPLGERINYDQTYSSAPPVAIDPGSPSYLSAGDIMLALGSLLTPRSDTFVIRTYGAVHDPLDSNADNAAAALPVNPQASARLEVVVQRVAQPMLSDDNIETPSATGFGRKFKIISFRWLSSNDI